MKKSKVKRFNGLMGSYATGVQGAYADSLPRKAKKDKEDRIAADMKDAIEPLYPETLLLGGAARTAATAAGRGLLGSAERRLLRGDSEGLPSSKTLKRVLGENNPKVVTTKGNFEEFAGFRGRLKPSKSPVARNKILREEAKEAGIPIKEYLKGRAKARAEGVAPGVHWRDLLAKGGKVKKYEEGGKVKKALGPREQADVSKMEKEQRKSKTPIGDIEPVPGHYGKKYAAGGKVKKMAFGGQTSTPRPTNPLTNPSQYAAGKTAMKSPKPPMGGKPPYAGPRPGSAQPKPPAVSPGIMKGLEKRAIDRISMPSRKPDMGILPGYKGPKSSMGMKRGGKVGESKEMMNQEIGFFKKKKAPKAMIKHEEKEAKGMKRGGGKMMKFVEGGSIDGCAVSGKTKLKRVKM